MPHHKDGSTSDQEHSSPLIRPAASEVFTEDRLQQAAFRILPVLKHVAVSEAVWREMGDCLRLRERERLSRASLVHFLVHAGALTSDALTTRRSERLQAKADTKPGMPVAAPVVVSRARKSLSVCTDENRFVLQNTGEPVPSPLKKSGVRVAVLVPSETSTTFFSPGKHEYKSFYKGAKHTLFVPVTPDAKKARPPSRLPAGSAAIRRVGVRHFRVTLETVNAKEARILSQNQLAGLSCLEMFRAHGMCDFALKGRRYHWSHMVGLLLGGEHSMQNIFPGTAESNLNTLHAVERRILQLLHEGVEAVDMEVVPKYPENPDILLPEHVRFSLSWIQGGRACAETIIIYTVSASPLTHSMRDTLRLVREDESAEKASQSVSSHP